MSSQTCSTDDRAGLSEGFLAFHDLADLGFLRRGITSLWADVQPVDADDLNDLGDAIVDLHLEESRIASDPRVVSLALANMEPTNILSEVREYVDENNVAERIRRRGDPSLEDDGFGILFALDHVSTVVQEALRLQHTLDAGARKRLFEHRMAILAIEAVIRQNPLAFVDICDQMQAYCQERGITSGVIHELAFPSIEMVSAYLWLCEQV